MLKPFSPHPSQLDRAFLIQSIFRLLLFSFVMVVLLGRAASAGISHDEHQFVASSQVLAQAGQIPYLDYPFLHMPYQIPANSLAVILSSYHLLAVRFLNEFLYLISTIIVFLLAARLFQDLSPIFRNAASLLAVMAFLFDPSLMNMDGRALNHALPVLLSLIAFVLFITWISKNCPIPLVFWCGFTVGLAVGTRLSFAVLAVPFLVVFLVFPNTASILGRVKNILSFSAGLGLSLLPVFVLFLLAPEKFFFGNYVYIRLNTIYRQEVLFQDSMTPLSKLSYFYENILLHPAQLLLYGGLLFTALYLFVRWKRQQDPDRVVLALSILLSFVLLASGFAPTPLWPQYFFAPVPFVIISAFSCLPALPKAAPRLLLLALLAAALIVGIPIEQTARQIAVLLHPDQWIPLQTHHFAQQVHEIVPQGKIVSLAPTYLLEKGLQTYPPFVAGPFVWRTAPLLSEEGRAQYDLISFHELDRMLNADPPAAIITGFETDYGFDADSFGLLEKPFIDYAKAYGYKAYKTWKPDFWPGKVTLWTKAYNQ